jgi:hypothetical protein
MLFQVLPHLEQFGKIILWFRNDVRSRQAANKFARKLNIQRCHFVRYAKYITMYQTKCVLAPTMLKSARYRKDRAGTAIEIYAILLTRAETMFGKCGRGVVACM